MSDLYAAVKRERFGDLDSLTDELTRPVPPPPVRKGGTGLTRFEVLLLKVKRAA
jgi:hypothetical protein